MRCAAAVFVFCFFFLCNGAFAQTFIEKGGAKKNVTIVYNIATGHPDMVVIDANDLTDPSWNPPGTKQINIPLATYNRMPDFVTFQGYMASAITADIAASAVNAQTP